MNFSDTKARWSRWKHSNAYNPWLFLVALVLVFSTITFLWGGLEERSIRLLTTRPQELRIWRMTLWPCVTALVLALVVWHVRRANGLLDAAWWKLVATWIFLELFATLGLSMVMDESITVVLYQRAQTPETIGTHVVRAGVHRSGKGTDVRNYADVVTTAGEYMRVSTHRSTYTFISRDSVRVNDVCPLDTLPEGYPLVLHGRRSEYGFALDTVTSDEPCEK